jgi:protein O-GlcNAc transferase
MGVPVITMPGTTLCSRHSYGYLTTLGLHDTVAHDLDRYVDLAVSWANDLAGLAALRAGLRQRMLASPLCDADDFVRAFETACRIAWELHRTGQPPRSIDVPATGVIKRRPVSDPT